MSKKGRGKCKVVWRGEQVKKASADAMAKTLIEVGELVLGDVAEKKLAPLMLGTLLDSGRVTVGAPPDSAEVYKEALSGISGSTPKPPPNAPPRIEVHVSYSTPYAHRLHEDLTWKPRDWYYGIGERRPKKKGEGTKKTEREKGERKDNGRRGKQVNSDKIRSKEPIGGPKYLEKAVPERWAEFDKRLKRNMKRLGKGKGGS